MNELKFTDLSEGKQKERRDWVRDCRVHLSEEHERWGESFFKILTLANTGGIVVVASLIGSVAQFRSSICLRLTLTFFVIGLVLTLNAIRHEFSAGSKRLTYWDRNSVRYLNSEVPFGEFYEPFRKHSEIDTMDRLIAALPVVFFLAGTITAFVFLWT